MKELKNALLCGLVIIQYIQSTACYIPNNSPMHMKLDGGNLKHSMITKRRAINYR